MKELTGCHDHGLLIAAVLRELGIPAIIVEDVNKMQKKWVNTVKKYYNDFLVK